MGSDPDPEQLVKEVAYYRRQLDELAGENLKLDYSISGLRHEIKQKRLGFSILSELHKSFGEVKSSADALQRTIEVVNAQLGMDRSLALVPTSGSDAYTPAHWRGYREEEAEDVADFSFTPSESFGLREDDVLIVNQATPSTPLIEEIRSKLRLPYFLCVPIVIGSPVAFLVAGRLREAKPLYPPLDSGDADTFRAISGLLAAIIRNMKVSALEEMDRLKTDFFANISHEFRTPITLTLGPLQGLLSGHYGAVPASVSEQLQLMERNQQRLLRLINQILDLVKLEAGQMKLKASRVPDLNHFIMERVALFRGLAERKRIELRTALDPSVSSVELFMDLDGMDKVVFNLLSNAHKFTQVGAVTVESRVDGGSALIRVSDTGMGIPADQVPLLFNRFRQAAGTTSTDQKGTGLGLALVKEVVELHHGSIEVSSDRGKGTAFTVRLPLGRSHLPDDAIVDASGEGAARAPERGADVTMESADSGEAVAEYNRAAREHLDPSKPVILYVDDNADLRSYVRDVLRPHYNVFLGVNGLDGFERAQELKPDLILSDWMMPLETGDRFCARVRDNLELQATPFVLLTAKSGMESKLEGLTQGADDYLAKPFSEAEILARLRNLIRLRQSHLALKEELRAARDIQRALLPTLPTAVGAWELTGLYVPCEELSGDFFDIVDAPEATYFYLADVTSHGTAAAQITYVLRATFRDAVTTTDAAGLSNVVAETARGYASHNLPFDIAFQVWRVQKRDARVEYVLGGAPSPVRCSAGVVTALGGAPSPALSPKAPPNSAVITHVLAADPEGVYFLFTDGAYEFAAGKREFGRRRLAEALKKLPALGWEEVLRAELTREHGSTRFEDDLTVLRLAPRRNAGAPESAR